MKLYFSPTDSLLITDLAVKGLPIEALTATNTFDPSDTTYNTKLILSDSRSKLISLILNTKNSSPDPLSTTYTVKQSTSTLTDYRTGENKTYAISEGSSVTITSTTYPIAGTMDLIIRYNTVSKEVTGNFSIYR